MKYILCVWTIWLILCTGCIIWLLCDKIRALFQSINQSDAKIEAIKVQNSDTIHGVKTRNLDTTFQALFKSLNDQTVLGAADAQNLQNMCTDLFHKQSKNCLCPLDKKLLVSTGLSKNLEFDCVKRDEQTLTDLYNELLEFVRSNKVTYNPDDINNFDTPTGKFYTLRDIASSLDQTKFATNIKKLLDSQPWATSSTTLPDELLHITPYELKLNDGQLMWINPLSEVGDLNTDMQTYFSLLGELNAAKLCAIGRYYIDTYGAAGCPATISQSNAYKKLIDHINSMYTKYPNMLTQYIFSADGPDGVIVDVYPDSVKVHQGPYPYDALIREMTQHSQNIPKVIDQNTFFQYCNFDHEFSNPKYKYLLSPDKQKQIIQGEIETNATPVFKNKWVDFNGSKNIWRSQCGEWCGKYSQQFNDLTGKCD